MPRPVQAVFLIDVASLDGCDHNPLGFEQRINCIRHSCFKLLTYFGSQHTRWGSKFYWSKGLVRQRMDKRPFSDLNLDALQELEDELVHRFERYKACSTALDETKRPTASDPPCDIIRIALTQLASEYNWDAPEIASPVRGKRTRVLDRKEPVLNYIFHISRTPGSYEELEMFLGKASEGVNISQELMPADLQRLLLGAYKTRFIWIDTNTQSLGDFAAAIQKLNGKVIPLQALDECCGVKEPFSSLAHFYLHESRSCGPDKTTLLVADEPVCHVVCCFNLGAIQEHCQQIKVMYKTCCTLEECAFNSEGLLGYRIETSDARAGCLKILLGNAQAFGVQLSYKDHHICHGLLLPVNNVAFCIHTVSTSYPKQPLNLGPVSFDHAVPQASGKVFTATALEKWYVPSGSSTFLSSFCRSEPLAKEREMLLEKLQCNHFTKGQSLSTRAKSASWSYHHKRGTPLSVSPRSADMIANSYIRRRKRKQILQDRTKGQPPLLALPSKASDEAHLIEQLKESLEATLDSPSSASLLTCAQNIVSVVKHHRAESALETLDNNFVLSCAQIAQKYSNVPDCLSKRLREYQFQVLLMLEKQLHFNLSAETCVESTVSLLRTVSFIYSPSEANQFLRGPIKDNYLMSLRHIVLEISEELNVALFGESPSAQTLSDFGSLPSVSSMQSQGSYLSSNASLSSQKHADRGESRPVARMDLPQPSTRQIVVPKMSRQKETELLRPKRMCGNVRRGLFVSPSKRRTSQRPTTPKGRRVLKTTFVPETPVHKQGGQVVLRRQQRMRKRLGVKTTVQVIEETPQKLLQQPSPVSDRSEEKTPPAKCNPEGVSTTPFVGTAVSTPPTRSILKKNRLAEGHSCGISPHYNISCGSPTKYVAFSDLDSPKRRVSKRLLSSPCTPKHQSASAYPSKCDTPKQLLSRLEEQPSKETAWKTCSARITRSKCRETGLSPEDLFVLSQASPSKGQIKHQRKAFTPPSALSVLHLTSSPMLTKHHQT